MGQETSAVSIGAQTGRTSEMDNVSTPGRKRAQTITDCLAQAEDWRREAGHLRDHTAQPHLAPGVSAVLLREAVTADQMVECWMTAAEKA